MKPCKQCQRVLPLSEFHHNARRKDGHESRCKDCANAYKTAHASTTKAKRAKRLYADQHRKQRNRRLAKWRDANREKIAEAQRRYRERNRLKYQARNILNNALRDGMIVPMDCEVCGSKRSEAHHPDYSRPLKVRWLCKRHHSELHRKPL